MIGAMATHTAIEHSAVVRDGWEALAACFGEVANVRVRNAATIGGVLADADYASDPPCDAARARRPRRAGAGPAASATWASAS